jgi:hypothetical protein
LVPWFFRLISRIYEREHVLADPNNTLDDLGFLHKPLDQVDDNGFHLSAKDNVVHKIFDHRLGQLDSLFWPKFDQLCHLLHEKEVCVLQHYALLDGLGKGLDCLLDWHLRVLLVGWDQVLQDVGALVLVFHLFTHYLADQLVRLKGCRVFQFRELGHQLKK